MSAETFRQLASAKNLDPDTIEVLIKENYDSVSKLTEVTKDKLQSLDISQAQREILENWLADLTANNKDDNQDESKVKGQTGDYEVPSTPRPSRYQKCVNVAVTGQNAELQAAVINSIRGVSPDSSEAAKASSDDLLPFRIGSVENVLLWALPRVGDDDPEFLKRVEFANYDAIILCFAGSPTDGDTFLAKEAGTTRARMLIVCTNADLDNEAGKEASSGEADGELSDKIKSEVTEQLKASEVSRDDVYLISTKPDAGDRWDMAKLIKDVAELSKRPSPQGGATDAADQVAPADGGTKADDSAEKDRIEKLAATFMSEVKDVVAKAAKKTSVSVLHKEITKYKKAFGVEKDDLPSINLDSLETAVAQMMPDKKKLKDTLLSCFGARSKAAQAREATQKIRDTIEDEGPTLMENAINACKTAALERLSKSVS